MMLVILCFNPNVAMCRRVAQDPSTAPTACCHHSAACRFEGIFGTKESGWPLTSPWQMAMTSSHAGGDPDADCSYGVASSTARLSLGTSLAGSLLPRLSCGTRGSCSCGVGQHPSHVWSGEAFKAWNLHDPAFDSRLGQIFNT